MDKRVTARSPIAVLVFVVAMLGGAVPSALAAAKAEVHPAQSTSSFYLRGTNHYYVDFEAVPEGRGGAAEVKAEASFERYKDEFLNVTYSTQGRLFGDGGFEAKFPGIGRVKVHFKEETAHQTHYDEGPYCGDRVITNRRGAFVGFAGFHGKAGFTTAKARRGDGQIRETARQVCHLPNAPKAASVSAPTPTPAPEAPPPERSATINASGRSGAAAVHFSSVGANIDETGFGAGGLPTIDFEANYKSELRGMGVTASAYVDSPTSDAFSIPSPVGALADATIAPPKPFSGTGIFHLETPTSASWTGDLAVALPGVGTVPLTGPGITAQLCEESCAPASTSR
jgi:hypothetical protein